MKTLKSEEAIAQSLQLIDKAFRGSLIIKASEVVKWKLYFRLGRLSWVTGGVNSNERLQRHLAYYCPQISQQQLKKIPLEHQPYREQKILVHLQGQGLIQRNQMANLMESIAVEVLFDAIQYGEVSANNLSCHQVAEEQNDNLLLLLPFLEIDAVLTKVQQQWHHWCSASLENYSPNLYPVIKRDILESVKNSTERQIVNSINGKNTIRSIAIHHQKPVLDVTRFLVSLANAGAVDFAKTPKTEIEVNSTKNNLAEAIIQKNIARSSQPSNKSANKQFPLVVCVDDSPLVCKAVKDIIADEDYRFLEIQEPIKVIPILLRKKPDLILLDLMMPIINGYELCAQLRKTPRLQDVPIIILTGKDGLIDRMRAKLVGSNDFMAKPVDKSTLLKMLSKYLTVE
jgi:chemotaxis family two-component system response regulator PixG